MGQSSSISTENFILPEKYLIPAPGDQERSARRRILALHPRSEVKKDFRGAVRGFLRPETIAPRCARNPSAGRIARKA